MSADPHTPGRGEHAWADLARAALVKRPVSERLADFLEVYGFYDEVTAREQASRCVQCAEPACVAGCPLSVHIPEWLALTADGHFREAAQLLHGTSSLPEICATLCPTDHQCEATCLIEGRAEPVSIQAVERFLNEYAFSHDIARQPVAPPNGRRVAVIGAGPGGLAAADGLARHGFAVTVFDHRLQAGGMLVYGTPAFRLEQSIVARRVELLRAMGVEFRLGLTIGREVGRQELESAFDAIYLALGAKRARSLDVPGAGLAGCLQAMPFIVQAGSEEARPLAAARVQGRHVLVLGGGETAIDCARTAVRCGAREVAVAYRRDEGSLRCARRDFEAALEEGVHFAFALAPVAILGDERGEVAGVRFARTALGSPDADGRRPFTLQPQSVVERTAHVVFLALGFEPEPLPADSPFRDLATGPDGRITVDPDHRTSAPGIFAGGDLVRGPCTALLAVRDARRAVQGIRTWCGRQPAPAAR